MRVSFKSFRVEPDRKNPFKLPQLEECYNIFYERLDEHRFMDGDNGSGTDAIAKSFKQHLCEEVTFVSTPGKEEMFYNLVLDGRGFGEHGLGACSELLHRNLTIRRLVVANDSFGANGAAELGNALRFNTALEELCVRHVADLGNLGVVNVVRNIKLNRNLKELVFDDCGIGDEGLNSILHILLCDTKLVRLSMSGNRFTEQACFSVSRVLKANFFIEEFTVERNEPSLEGFACALEPSLTRNQAVRETIDYLLEKSTDPEVIKVIKYRPDQSGSLKRRRSSGTRPMVDCVPLTPDGKPGTIAGRPFCFGIADMVVSSNPVV
jgi:hypothetical protein